MNQPDPAAEGLAGELGWSAPLTPLQERIEALSHRRRYYREARWEYGEPWEAWKDPVRAFLASPRTDRGHEKHIHGFPFDADTLEWRIRYQQPWPRPSEEGAWEEYWRREISPSIDDETIRRLEHIRWDSPVSVSDTGGVLVHPVTRGGDLARLRREIKNCLLTHLNRCETGETRIFALYDAVWLRMELIGTGEFVWDKHRWTLGQVEGLDCRPITGGAALEVMEEALRRKLQEAPNKST